MLTDVVMPGMTGPASAKELAAIRPETRVLYMSGYSPDFYSGFPEEGMSLVQKPFSRDTLLRRLRRVLDDGN